MPRSRWETLENWIALIGIAGSFALFLFGLTAQSFDIDEGWSSFFVRKPWGEMWARLLPDNHPPLYYVLLKGWITCAGDTDWSMRFFSVMAAVLAIAWLYRLLRDYASRQAALIGVFLALLSPALHYYAQEARMYTLLILLAVGSTWFLLRTIESAERRWKVAYAATMAATLYTHYIAGLLWIAHGVVIGAAAWRNRPRSWRTFLSQMWPWMGACALFLPWVPVVFYQWHVGQGTLWRTTLPWSFILRDGWAFLWFGHTRPDPPPPLWSFPSVPPLLVIGLGAILGLRHRPLLWGALIATGLGPLAAIAFLGDLFPFYTDRYLIVLLPFMFALFALGTEELGKRWPRRSVALTFLLSLSWGVVTGQATWQVTHNPQFTREDFRAAAAYVNSTATADDLVVVIGCVPPLAHYYRGPAPMLGFPEEGDWVRDEGEVASRLRQVARPGQQVYVVSYNWWAADPQDLVLGQLLAHGEELGEHWITPPEGGRQKPIRVINLALHDARFAAEPRWPVDALFAPGIALRAYHVRGEPSAGRTLIVALWWEVTEPLERNYTAFVHLVGADGQLIAQHDKLPLSDFFPIGRWPQGEVLRDEYKLDIPPDAQLEGAHLAVGLYNEDGRLPVLHGPAVHDRAIELPLAPP